jgi:hypothetical protein
VHRLDSEADSPDYPSPLALNAEERYERSTKPTVSVLSMYVLYPDDGRTGKTLNSLSTLDTVHYKYKYTDYKSC